jgi:hypothetical protein
MPFTRPLHDQPKSRKFVGGSCCEYATEINGSSAARVGVHAIDVNGPSVVAKKFSDISNVASHRLQRHEQLMGTPPHERFQDVVPGPR